MDSPIEEIKNRLDLVEVVSGYIKLKKAGANFAALCPFHKDKNPSLFVSPSRQIWKCFGCGLGGDLFKFVMQIEGVEFGDALKILAQRAGVELRPQRPELRTQRQRLYEICDLASKFFEKQLQESKAGKNVKEYLLKRGITQESQVFWRLGYAPNAWQGLISFLNSQGYKKQEIERTGLAIKNERGGYFDRFRARIMFPIFDLNSQIIGLAGRVLEGQKVELAKYMNVPNTLLYDKSKVLYGLDRAKVEVRKKDSCVLVEGYTDVILSHQMGIKNVVASSGTALTSFHLRTLKRYSEKLILAFDMDVAGNSATKRGIDLAQAMGFDIKIAVLPEEQDPADVISQNPEQWSKIIKAGRGILDYYFQNAFGRWDKGSAEGKKEIARALLPILKRIPNRILQSHWTQKLAQELRVGEKDVQEELDKIKDQRFEEIEASEELEEGPADGKNSKTRCLLLEQRLLALAFQDPENLRLLTKEDLGILSPPFLKALTFLKQRAGDEELEKKLPKTLLEELQMMSFELEVREPEIESSLEFQKCLKEIRILRLREELKNVSQEVKRAEQTQDRSRVWALMERFDRLTKELQEQP